MDIPPDVVDRIQRHWEAIPPDVQARLSNAGISGTTTATTPPEGLRTMAAEAGGGLIGGLTGGPAGAGAGMAAGGAAEDLAAGRPFSEGRAESRATFGYAGEAGGSALRAGVGKVAGAVAERFPSFAEFIEGASPGFLKRGERALKATGDLGKDTPEVIASRFHQWSDAMFEHVEKLVGQHDVIPVDAIQQAAAETNITAAPLTPAEKSSFTRALTGQDKISFRDARNLEQGFGRLARARVGSKAEGDAVSHQWAIMRNAVRTDIESFLDPDANVAMGPHRPMEPGGQALKDARATYREGKQAVASTGIYRSAVTPGGRFDPGGFARGVKTFDDQGILERTVGKERAEILRGLRDEFGAQTEAGDKVGMAKRVVGKAILPAAAAGAGVHAYKSGNLGADALPLAALAATLHPATRPYAGALLRQMGAAGAQGYLEANPQLKRYLDPDIPIQGLGAQP
jgi:hypothetical protein